MGYKRANWHSGLTYVQTCEECKQVVEYTDFQLGFRPWYPDGFVYCTRCQTPLRHNENYALPADQQPVNQPVSQATEGPVDQTVPTETAAPVTEGELPAFCTNCGKAFREGDRFCSGCGKKRE